MIPFEKFGDDFIDAVSSKLDLKGMSASPPDDDDDLLGKGEIPKDAEEKLGGGQEAPRSCSQPESINCVREGDFCAYMCISVGVFAPVAIMCHVTQPGDPVHCVEDFECPSEFTCDGSDTGFACDDGFTCPVVIPPTM